VSFALKTACDLRHTIKKPPLPQIFILRSLRVSGFAFIFPLEIIRTVVLFYLDMPATLTIHDGRLIKGNETRAAILQVAIQIASEEGLEGLSLGRLADDVGMSKSGLFAHFRSKEDLQLAVVDAARDLFIAQVVTPARKFPAGIQRLRKLADTWLAYAQGHVFRGGCFFVAASMEFDSRPGRVRDRVCELMAGWLAALAQGPATGRARVTRLARTAAPGGAGRMLCQLQR